MKLYWELFEKWFPNDILLDGFYNPLKVYLSEKTGTIIDIGCGPSPHLIDMLDSPFLLYALDKDPLQLEYLKKRVIQKGWNPNRISYFTGEFDEKKFRGEFFSGIILSNLLHFFSFPTAIQFISELESHMISKTCVLVTVHSQKHPKSKEKKSKDDYFKHFYSIKDLHTLFPKTKFEYLYTSEILKYPETLQKEFLKEWIKEIFIQTHKRNDVHAIERFQQNYFNESSTGSITLLVQRK